MAIPGGLADVADQRHRDRRARRRARHHRDQGWTGRLSCFRTQAGLRHGGRGGADVRRPRREDERAGARGRAGRSRRGCRLRRHSAHSGLLEAVEAGFVCPRGSRPGPQLRVRRRQRRLRAPALPRDARVLRPALRHRRRPRPRVPRLPLPRLPPQGRLPRVEREDGTARLGERLARRRRLRPLRGELGDQHRHAAVGLRDVPADRGS